MTSPDSLVALQKIKKFLRSLESSQRHRREDVPPGLTNTPDSRPPVLVKTVPALPVVATVAGVDDVEFLELPEDVEDVPGRPDLPAEPVIPAPPRGLGCEY